MGFSKKIKDDILVASARHCCVCHRYKGVKIEIHHILPKEQGGKDSFENAIALCFDCHSDVGHYNVKHPRGTKISIDELKKHKATWFDVVKNNAIPQKEENLVHARYLITKEFDIIKSISNRNLSRFPIEECLLADNQPLDSFRKLFKEQDYRNLEVVHSIDMSPGEYSMKYPDAIILNSKEDEYKSYFNERIPSISEIDKVCSLDKLSVFLSRNNIEAFKIAKVLTCYDTECGGSGVFVELFLLRPLYFKFLILTNITGKYIKFKKLRALTNDECLFDGKDFKCEKDLQLPNMLIHPNQSVIIPLGMFLADYKDLDKSESYTRIYDSGGDRSTVLDHVNENTNQTIEYFLKNYQPKELVFEKEGQVYKQDIHDFDFNSIYWIDGYWNCGSCPHMFYEMNDFRLVYKGEIFKEKPGVITSHSFIIGEFVKKVIIAELEHELTTIKNITLNGIEIFSNIRLSNGQDIKIPVSKNDILEITGFYSTTANNYLKLSLVEKLNLTSKFKRVYASK
jgi:hypothetical protein